MITIFLSNRRAVSLAVDDSDAQGGFINMCDVAAQLSDSDALQFIEDLLAYKSPSFWEDVRRLVR